MFKSILTLLLLTSYITLWSQDYEVKNIDYNMDLHPPMEIDLILAGNFCEMRSNHFHTGLDIKTQRVEGQKIFSIEDGFISRIRVSPWGYGNAIYIQHKNGLTSLYAHCQKFPPKIDSLIYEIQRSYETHIIDKEVIDLKIPIKKGELIAYSGNSGSSSAPHLHFEIRETSTEHALNPLLFKSYQNLIKDSTPPQIRGIKIYTITKNGYLIPGKSKYFGVRNENGKLIINNGKPINIDELLVENSFLAIGVHAIDKLDAAGNTCGIYNTKISKDGQPIHEQKTEYMNFDHNRFMNSHKDYTAFKKEKKHIHKQFTTNVNPLPIYPLNNGKIKCENRSGKYEVTIFDAHQNKLTFEFSIEAIENNYKKNFFDNNSKYIFPDTVNFILKDEMQVLFESGTFYEPLEIIYKKEKTDSNSRFIGDFHSFADNTIPVQKKYDIRIKCPTLPNDYPYSKLGIIYKDSKNRIQYVGGTYFDGWVEGRVRAFGKFSLLLDTISPIIKPLDFDNNKIITKYRTLELTIQDNLSGVKNYKAYINDKWVLMIYDRKKRKYIIPLNYRSKIHLKKGENEIKITSSDSQKNKSFIIKTVIY